MVRPRMMTRKISSSVTLSEDAKKLFRKAGNGNLSLGIELSAKKVVEQEFELKELRRMRDALIQEKLVN